MREMPLHPLCFVVMPFGSKDVVGRSAGRGAQVCRPWRRSVGRSRTCSRA